MADTATTLQELHKEVSNELSTLSRVSHRLAMTDAGPQLVKVLNLLLPRLLCRIGTNHVKTTEFTRTYSLSNEMEKAIKGVYDGIFAKLVEMMSHIIKRVRADAACQLPCSAILEIMYDFEKKTAMDPTLINPFTLNLSLTFLTIGVPRCPVDQLEIMLPGLLAMLGVHSSLASLQSDSRKKQSFQVAHLVLRAVEGIVVGNRKVANKAFSSTITPPSASLSGAKSSDVSAAAENESDAGEKENPLEIVRKLCSENEAIGAVAYDLLLDVLLYQNTVGNIPPPGLSQIGKERLASGNSVVAESWSMEHATGSRLKDLKLVLLDFIAPCRRFDVFDAAKRPDLENKPALSTARAVALLVVASGDQNLDVAERASSYLKAHMDSLRNMTRKGKESDGDGDRQSNEERGTGDLLGDPIALICGLLTTLLGDIIAGNAIRKLGSTSQFDTCLGRNFSSDAQADTTIVLCTKRRMVSAQNSTTIMAFVLTRAIDDLPSVFTPPSMRQAVESMGRYFECCAERATVVGTLVLMAANKHAGSGNALSGLSLTSSAGNPSVAALKLLNSVCVRLVSLFDAMTDEGGVRGEDKASMQIHDILARSFVNACAIVSIASSPHSGDVRNAIGIEARDAAYGILCTISRSNMVSYDSGIVFNCGEAVSSDVEMLSTKTAKLLFGCVSNETETLKPRAVAALDSLLSAYCRLLEKSRSVTEEATDEKNEQSSNPWAVQVEADNGGAVALEVKFAGLTNSLLPLLWNALQPTSPKASRHAAAQWTSSLLKSLDLNSACHILCFIAGDKDGTSASLAINGLGLEAQVGGEVVTLTSEGKDFIVPDFNDFVAAVFSNRSNMTSWRPTFHEFSPKGRGAAIRFGLVCLLSDMYGGDDSTTAKYLNCVSDTLSGFESTGGVSSKQSPGKIDLLDETSICFAALLRTSQFARASIVNGSISLTIARVSELSLSVSSSKARRYLASACLYLFEDASIWKETGQFDLNQWIRKSCIGQIAQTCGKILGEMTSTTFVAAKLHGAAYVGASCVRALTMCASKEELSTQLQECLQHASTIVSFLGRGVLHSDEAIGNACAGALSIAFSYDTEDAPVLCEILHNGASVAMKQMNTALRRYGNGDHTDPQRAALLAKATGVALAATTVHQEPANSDAPESESKKGDDIGKRRLDCVDALFALLGSSANRKDLELPLLVGEALASYADAYSPEGCTWTYPETELPSTFDQSYANDLPPHAQVSL